MNKLKWLFDLRQHTPMIHFQPIDNGVCLRSTEVKPKFDRFLLANECFSDKQKAKWFYTAENGQLSSKMKMRFRAKGEVIRSCVYETKQKGNLKKNISGKSNNGINPLYFGNQGCKERETVKETIFYKEGIKGILICFDKEFLEIVKSYIPVFFLLYNFGTRQNKGFGSFSVTGENRVKDSFSMIQKYRPNAYYLDYNDLKKGKTVSEEERLDDIDILYGLMKGGINDTHAQQDSKKYYKGAIFRYYLQKNIINEKKAIKQYFFDERSKKDIEDAYFVRAVLGLTDNYRYNDNIRKGTVLVSNNEIKRFQSPIYFKVLGRYTFLFLSPLPEALKNADFIFSLKNKDIQPIKLTIPDFDIEEFMEWFAEDFNSKEQIIEQDTKKLIRGSLKASDNKKFIRIEKLKLRRYKE